MNSHVYKRFNHAGDTLISVAEPTGGYFLPEGRRYTCERNMRDVSVQLKTVSEIWCD